VYSSLSEHLYHIGHYALAFWVLMIGYPRLIFASHYEDKLEQTFSNGLRIVALYIIMGYILVALKLFEVLSIIGLLIFIILRDYFLPQSSEKRMGAFTAFSAKFYDLIETSYRSKLWWQRFRGKPLLADKRKQWRGLSAYTVIPGILLTTVLASSVFVRFYDAWVSVAPSMSDGAVTLAWLNYINQRILFHDGIYPQGLYIMLAYMHKFAAIDQMYIAKYSGPIYCSLIVLSLYFVVSRLTGNRIAAIAAAAVYGLAGEALHGEPDWVRQSATNAQELAMVLLLPTFYFCLRYFKNGKASDFWTATAGSTAIGLIHSVVFAYAGLGLGILLVLCLLMGEERKKKFFSGMLTGFGCLFIALAPLAGGLLMGRELHSSSANFALQEVVVERPLLTAWDIIGVLCLLILFIVQFIVKTNQERWMYRFAVLFGSFSFILYEFVGAWTQNAVFATRTESIWVLSICFLFGLVWHLLFSIRMLSGENANLWAESTLCALLVLSIIMQTKLEPIIPYKMMWDSAATQYLRIAERHLPSTWIAFSQSEGYSLTLGRGFHNYITTLIRDYDPQLFPLTKRGTTLPDPNISYHIYIFEEKQVFRVDRRNKVVYQTLEQEYERREVEYPKLRNWLEEYQEQHDDLVTFYEDEHIKVYYIYRPGDPDAKDEALWGKPRLSEWQEDGM
jgi:hypothetical protein